jgi:hypothetical protein
VTHVTVTMAASTRINLYQSDAGEAEIDPGERHSGSPKDPFDLKPFFSPTVSDPTKNNIRDLICGPGICPPHRCLHSPWPGRRAPVVGKPGERLGRLTAVFFPAAERVVEPRLRGRELLWHDREAKRRAAVGGRDGDLARSGAHFHREADPNSPSRSPGSAIAHPAATRVSSPSMLTRTEAALAPCTQNVMERGAAGSPAHRARICSLESFGKS